MQKKKNKPGKNDGEVEEMYDNAVLKEISDAVLDVDCRLQEILHVIERLELSAEATREASCICALSVIHYYLTHLEKELNEWGNKFDMYLLKGW